MTNVVSYHTLKENNIDVKVMVPFLVTFGGENHEDFVPLDRTDNFNSEQVNLILPDEMLNWLNKNEIGYQLSIWRGDDIFSKDKTSRYISGIEFELEEDMLQFQMRWLTTW